MSSGGMPGVTESVLSFECDGTLLTGIHARPARPGKTGVLVIVGGPQYRAGSHRQFVLLTRRLAAAGYDALRFDYRGMGDSGGPLRDFEQVGDDIAAALTALLAAAPTLRRVVLWGLCDGASAALLYLQQRSDPRVAGLCLVNPWVRSAVSLARTQLRHYYLQRLAQKEFWLKLLSGRVAGRALRELWQSLRLASAGRQDAGSGPATAAAYQERMLQGLAGFGGPVQLLLSGRDYTAREFADYAAAHPDWRQALRRPGVHEAELPDADHTCSERSSQALLEELSVQWLREHWDGGRPAT